MKTVLSTMRYALVAAIILFAVNGMPRAMAQSNDDCFACHGDKDMEGEGGRKVYVDPAKFAESIHGTNEVECVMCHQDLSGFTDFPHKPKLEHADCSACHSDQEAKYILGIHGKTHKAGNKDAPSCADCHGSHHILPKENPDSLINPLNIPKICDRCHADPKLAQRNGLPDVTFINSYQNGVHGKALMKAGLVSAATCISCHRPHEILPLKDQNSPINRKNIPRTCGRCHAGIYQQYIQSVHGLDYLKGISDVPVCTDCHGEHDILAHEDPASSVFATKVGETCSKCHDNAELERKFNLPPDRLRSYEGTYHGVASMGGNVKVANCASCHGVHNILPSSNPNSMVNERNLPTTCGKPQCHGSRLENVVKGKVHIIETKRDNIWVYIVSNVYKVFISMVIGGFLIFIIVDLYARLRRHRKIVSAKKKRGEPHV